MTIGREGIGGLREAPAARVLSDAPAPEPNNEAPFERDREGISQWRTYETGNKKS